jgi:hypothetical protein
MKDTLDDFLQWSAKNYRLPQFIDDAYKQFKTALVTQASEEAGNIMQEALNPNELLSNIGPKRPKAMLTRHRLVAFWREEYLRYIQKPPRKLYAHEGALLDKLILCYNGSEDILLMITTFMQNYKAVPGFDGYPNIGALWGWKDTLMKMALEGSKRKQGQAQMVDKEGADVFG